MRRRRDARLTAGGDVVPLRVPAAGRACGPCTACCRAPGVLRVPGCPDGHKPSGQDCPHQLAPGPAGGGCALYADRPRDCRAFVCEWLAGWGDDADRPDRLGVYFDARPWIGAVACVEVDAGRAADPRARQARARWAVTGLRPWLYAYGDRPNVGAEWTT